MTRAFTSHTAAGTWRLLRRVDGVELPVAGTWTVPGTHASITFAVPRRLRQPDSRIGRAREATLVFSQDPDNVRVAVLCDPPVDLVPASRAPAIGAPIRLVAQAVPGPHRWALSGEVFTDTGVLPLRGSLGYHGVWRRGDRAYAWFVLTGTIGPPDTRRRLEFNFELLAYGPETASRPATAPCPIGPTTQTRGAA